MMRCSDCPMLPRSPKSRSGSPHWWAGANPDACRSQLGRNQVEEWARGEAEGTGLEWRELLAGAASSVLALHALIAAAADPRTTPAEAEEIASAYLCICVPLTLLDGLVDHDEDTRAGEGTHGHGPGGLGYLDLYEDRDELSQALTDATRRAILQARALRHGPHHAITLVGSWPTTPPPRAPGASSPRRSQGAGAARAL